MQYAYEKDGLDVTLEPSLRFASCPLMDNVEMDNDYDTSRNLLDSFNSDGELNFVIFIKENYLNKCL